MILKENMISDVIWFQMWYDFEDKYDFESEYDFEKWYGLNSICDISYDSVLKM